MFSKKRLIHLGLNYARHANTPTLRYANTPALQHSNTPALLYRFLQVTRDHNLFQYNVRLISVPEFEIRIQVGLGARPMRCVNTLTATRNSTLQNVRKATVGTLFRRTL